MDTKPPEKMLSEEKAEVTSKNRILAIDRLRSIAILFVALHHSIIPYCKRGIPWWYVQDTKGVIWFDIIILLNDTFMMPILFFVSGYLLSFSWHRQPRPFLVAKAKRLLLPLFVGVGVLGPIIAYVHAIGGEDGPMSYLHFWIFEYLARQLEHFHYWFLGVLFLFMAFARLGRSWLVSQAENCQFFQHLGCMRLSWLYLYMLLLGFLSLLISVLYPFEGWINLSGLFVCQPSRIPFYGGFFLLGLFVAKSPWDPSKASSLPVLHLIIPVAVLLSISLVAIRAPGVLPGNVQFFLSALLYPAVGASWFLILVRVAQALDRLPHRFRISRASYGIYLLHLPILVVLQYLVINQPIDPAIKAFSLGILAVVASYMLTHLLLRLPGVGGVL
ncbi:acyltransferase family protein [Desulfatitalea alkaliphila]|uniref:Acyltransferase n=1 Tax=Desulfatitalea alkaliphila TaxID=2929485 RepID=A0AA41UMU6_9BACT|nr:acyltransferase [Desulfatitalea alkaliphila]MCJ8503026.1 acyltransferase [Desulfatitalea alkaliphila]